MRRTDIKKILLIGSGPIVIGQACEFDYSGTQALKALREEGFEVILVNSNPATIMTDPELSDRVYLEPLTPEYLERIIERERPDALLPTMGGQTALNLTMQLHQAGRSRKIPRRSLGATPEAIHKAEDRETFKATMKSIGVNSARSMVCRNQEDGQKILKEIGLPLILRPSFTLGGEGGGTAYTEEEFLQKLDRALFLSPSKDVLVEENLIVAGKSSSSKWSVAIKTTTSLLFVRLKILRPDGGVHTQETVSLLRLLGDFDRSREYQNLSDQSIRDHSRATSGVETGGSNIQFAINPQDGRVIVIEMNPRVSRSSALASKATGFPDRSRCCKARGGLHARRTDK